MNILKGIFITCLFTILFIPHFTLAQPAPYSIIPSYGLPGTEIIIHGRDFMPGAKAALYGGEGALVGRWNYAGISGMKVIDANNPASPYLVGNYSLTTPTGIAVSDGFAYFDFKAAISGNYAYTVISKGADNLALTVVDISDPTSLVFVSECFLGSGRPMDVVTDGQHAYVASGWSGFHIVDISNPVSPFVVRRIDTGWSWAVTISENFAYVYGTDFWDDDLKVIDISTPTSAQIVGGAYAGDLPWDISVSGNYAFVSDSGLNSWLRVFDISNPTSPYQIVNYVLSSPHIHNRANFISGDYLYVATANGLDVIDISDPISPLYVGSANPVVPYSYDVNVSEGNVYVLSRNGLNIVTTFLALEDLIWLDAKRFTAKVPSNQKSGIWDLHVTNPDDSHNVLIDAFTVIDIEIEIDIKPGRDRNRINCTKADKVIPAAILTTDEFDALTVDHTTITLAGASELHKNKKTGELRRHEKDVDNDGDTDLMFHFALSDSNLSCDSDNATLMGETFDGLIVAGSDTVRMIKCGRKKKNP